MINIEDISKLGLNLGSKSPELIKALLGLSNLNITTVEQAKKEHYRAKEGSVHHQSTYLRWLDLSQREIEDAKTLHEAQKAYEQAPTGSDVKMYGLEKLLEFAVTEKAIKGIINQSSQYSMVKRKALKKLAALYYTVEN
jgi:bifunctional pyridoxal-dependent enzyme with beta-cystathionase and maltose regulon repressor activities